MKSTVVTVMYWWVSIFLVWLIGTSPLHLVWLMPLALFLPSMIMIYLFMSPANTVINIALLSGIVLGPALVLVGYLG